MNNNNYPTQRYLNDLINQWYYGNYGYTKFNKDVDDYFTHIYLYLGQQYNSNTHIHIFWERYEKNYMWQITCFNNGKKIHGGKNIFDDSISMNQYIYIFENELNECYNNQNGGKKNKLDEIVNKKKSKEIIKKLK